VTLCYQPDYGCCRTSNRRFQFRTVSPRSLRGVLALTVVQTPEALRRRQPRRHAAAGAVALAEGNAPDAIAAFRKWRDEFLCVTWGLLDLATAYEQARQPDSAPTTYLRFVSTAEPAWLPPGVSRLLVDRFYSVAAAYHRLGELYEARGDRAKAIDSYAHFVELWKDADPELEPIVRDARARMARLAGEH